MRRTIFIIFVLLGAAVGMLATLNDGWGLKGVMIAIGAVAGAVFGGVLTKIGTRSVTRDPSLALDAAYGQGTASEDRDRNYWRDKGHPPFMRPSNSEPDRHMFDPDRLD